MNQSDSLAVTAQIRPVWGRCHTQHTDVRTVASLLGHAQASKTLDIYAHAFDKNKRKAQEKLGKAIGL